MIELNQILHADCMDIMKDIPDKYFDLIIADPPYNIGKAEWDKIKNYIEWCGKWILECQRVLKENGSIYIFHNDMMQLKDIMTWIENNSNFIFKQFIVWNKKFKGSKNEGYLQGYIESGLNRNYQKFAEYILFYTFQDETGLKKNYNDLTLFRELRDYFYNERKKTKLSLKEINRDVLKTTHTGGGMASNILVPYKLGWTFPTKNQYEKLQKIGICKIKYNILLDKYNRLKNQYESKRIENEKNRYTFNNQKTHHSIWNYDIDSSNDHISIKPIALIKNILLHSSNENDIVLDLFSGSGRTAIACHLFNRNFLAIEKDKDYWKASVERYETEISQGKLF